MVLRTLTAWLLVGAFGPLAWAQSTEPRLKIDVAPDAPCVITQEGQRPCGFDIDVLTEACNRLGLSFEFREVQFVHIFDGVERGEADLAAAGISITSQRLDRVEFSYPYLNAGLGILVKKQHGATVSAIIAAFLTPGTLRFAAAWLGILVVGGTLTWLFERKSQIFNRHPAKGIGEAIWYSQVTAATVGYGDFVPKTVLGRLTGVFIMFFGMGVVTILISSITASLTVQEIRSSIRGQHDLRGRLVATKQGSTSEEALRQLGAEVRTVKHIEDAYPLLAKGTVDAVVFDAPVLRYHATQVAPEQFAVIGQPFKLQDYGFVFKKGSPLAQRFDKVLLDMKQDGTLEKLKDRWFGAD